MKKEQHNKKKAKSEKAKEEKAILAELSMLAEIRKRHEWAVVGQQEAQNLEKAEEELDIEASDSDKVGGGNMPDELTELLGTAIYKEIASQAFYIAGQKKTQDPGAKALMKELAAEELKHSELLKNLKEKGIRKRTGT